MKSNFLRTLLTILVALSFLLSTGQNSFAAPLPDDPPPPTSGPGASDKDTPPPTPEIASESHSGSSPYDPPQKSDTVFFRDSYTTMDEYRFRSESPIQFTIPVDRVVGRTDSQGYLSNINTLIANGVVANTVELKLVVWDVDEDGGEVDKIYVNDHYVGDLSGSNQTWSQRSFAVPTQYIRFAIPKCGSAIDNGQSEDHLSQCSHAPTAVENVIRIDIDTENSEDTWAVTVDWGALTLSAARPTLFVHGKGGDKIEAGNFIYWDKNDRDLWFGFRKKISNAGFLTAITEDRLGAEDTSYENATDLRDVIRDVKKHFGVQKVNLVGHSKGGLDSRAYISSSWLNTANDVEKLITLASPHHGSYLADYSMANPVLSEVIGRHVTPAVAMLTEPSMRSFNYMMRGKEGVKYYTIAADASIHTSSTERVLLPEQRLSSDNNFFTWAGAMFAWDLLYDGGDYRGDNDFMVTVRSASLSDVKGHDNGDTQDLGTYYLNHHSIRAALALKGIEDNTIVNLVQNTISYKNNSSPKLSLDAQAFPILTDENEEEAKPESMLEAESVEAAAAPVLPSSSISIIEGMVQSGQMSETEVSIDSTTHASFAVLWTDGTLGLSLVEPTTGRVITPETVDANVQYEINLEEPGAMDLLPGKMITYAVANPTPGKWKLQVSGGEDLPNGTTTYALIVPQQSALTLSLGPTLPWYRINEKATIQATLLNSKIPVKNAIVGVTITMPDGTLQPLSLYDNGKLGDARAGDGVYTNQLIVTHSGVYRLSADATGDAPQEFQRTAVSEFAVGSNSAALSKPIREFGADLENDGMIDMLRLSIPMKVTRAGKYRVQGTLMDSHKRLMGEADVTLDLLSGGNTVTLDFDGNAIWKNGGKGRFYLKNVRVIDLSDDQPVQVDFLASAYTTRSYKQSQFQHLPIVFTGNPIETTSDTNRNGKYDTITFTYPLFIDKTGLYQWNARLMADDGTEIGWVRFEKKLTTGLNKITVTFDGNVISHAASDGPYSIKDLSISGMKGSANLVDAGVSKAYSSSDFEFGPLLLYPSNTARVSSLKNVYLEWEDFTENGAVVYKVLVSRNIGFTSLLKTGYVVAPDSFYVLPAVTRNTRYYWKVIAYSDATGKNLIGQSQVWSFQAPNPPATPTPISPVSKTISPEYPVFTWRGSSSATYYYLVVSSDPSFSSSVIDLWVYKSTKFQYDDVLESGTTYYWRVIAQNALGDYSAWSRTVQFKTAP